MRNWFVLFSTTFTMTILVLVNVNSGGFDNQYILLLAMLSALLSFYSNMSNKLQIKSSLLHALLDIFIITAIVYAATVIILNQSINLSSFIFTLLVVIVIYYIIKLIYFFILTKEAENMNKKIKNWRKKHVDR